MRKKCRSLETENRNLKKTITKLKAGEHDIELDGQTQEDVTEVLHQCMKAPILNDLIKKQDDTGALKAFWEEQVTRSAASTEKRKKWNPVGLYVYIWCL